MIQTHQDPIFTFDTADSSIVRISLSETGKDLARENIEGVLEDLMENIDQSLRGSGYIYNITLNKEELQIDITSFDSTESFNQEVFDLIAEELQFSDSLLRDEE